MTMQDYVEACLLAELTKFLETDCSLDCTQYHSSGTPLYLMLVINANRLLVMPRRMQNARALLYLHEVLFSERYLTFLAHCHIAVC